MSEPTNYAKVENGIVTDVRVVAYDFIVANPERYGDASLWHDAHFKTQGKKYAGIGDIYDAEADEFVSPVSEFQSASYEPSPESTQG